jgi:hypothetical protein
VHTPTLISVYGTREKAVSEANWRHRDGRTNIKITHISTEKLRWDLLVLNGSMVVDVLVDFNYGMWAVFVWATDLIRIFGPNGQLKQGVEGGARDEWFAIDWIPRNQVISEELV